MIAQLPQVGRLWATTMGVILAMIAFVVAMAVAPSPAQAYTSVGSCTIQALDPDVATDLNYGQAHAETYCRTGYRVDVTVQLWGDDPGGVSSGDDLLSNTTHYGYLVRGRYSYDWYSRNVNCNEDIGIDELYSRARFKVYTSTGTATTAWSQSRTTYHSC